MATYEEYKEWREQRQEEMQNNPEWKQDAMEESRDYIERREAAGDSNEELQFEGVSRALQAYFGKYASLYGQTESDEDRSVLQYVNSQLGAGTSYRFAKTEGGAITTESVETDPTPDPEESEDNEEPMADGGVSAGDIFQDFTDPDVNATQNIIEGAQERAESVDPTGTISGDSDSPDSGGSNGGGSNGGGPWVDNGPSDFIPDWAKWAVAGVIAIAFGMVVTE